MLDSRHTLCGRHKALESSACDAASELLCEGGDWKGIQLLHDLVITSSWPAAQAEPCVFNLNCRLV